MLKRLVASKEGTIKSFLLILLTLSFIIAGIVWALTSVSVNTPVAGANISGTDATFNVTITGNGALNATFYWQNGSTLVTIGSVNLSTYCNCTNPASIAIRNSTAAIWASDIPRVAINVSIWDAVDNWNTSIAGINVDNTAPTVRNESQINATTNNTAYVINFYYNVTDNFVVANCSLYLNGARNATAQNPPNNTVNNLTVNFSNIGGERQFRVSINCTDYVGLNGSSFAFGGLAGNFTVNTTQSLTMALESTDYHAIVVSQGNGNTNITYNLSLTNNGSITDTFSLVVSNNNSANVAVLNQSSVTLASGLSANVTLTVAHDNNVTTNLTISVIANSTLASAYAVVTTHTNVTDVAPTQIRGNASITNNSYLTTSTVMLNYTIDDLNPANCSLYTNFDGSWGIDQSDTKVRNGTNQFNSTDVKDNSSGYLYMVQCADNSSQRITSSNLTVKVDTQSPRVWQAAVYGFIANSTENYTTKNLGFFFNASDGGFNVSYCNLLLSTGASKTLVANATMNVSSTLQTNSSVNNFNFTLANGDYLWAVNCSDDAGNINTSSVWAFNVSEYGMNLTASAGQATVVTNRTTEVNVNTTYVLTVTNNGTNTSSFTLAVNLTSGIQTALLNQTAVTLNPGAKANVTLIATNGTHGNYTLQVTMASDRNANLVNFTLISNLNVTDRAPAVTITQRGFANNTFSANGAINFTVSVNDLNPANCTLYVSVNGTPSNLTKDIFVLNGTLNISGLSQNATPLNFSIGRAVTNNASGFWWNVSCRDNSNNEGVSPVHIFKVDTTTPNITSINITAAHITLANTSARNELNGSYYLRNVSLNVSISVLGSNIDTVTLFYSIVNASNTNVTEGSSSIVMTASNGDSYNATIPATAIPGYLSNGSFIIKVNNSANNSRLETRGSNNYTFKIDNKAPSPSLTSTSAADAGNAITITCTASDQDNLIPSSPNLTTYADVLDPNGGRSSNVGSSYTTSTTAGTGTVYCIAVDLAGNNASVSKTFTTAGSGTGSGGSGGGSNTGATSLASESQTVSKFTAGTPASVTLSKEGDHGVSEISVQVKNDVTSVSVTVNKLNKNPLSTEVGAHVFNYLSISAPKLTNENIEKAKIKFKVEKKWLEDNDLDKNTAALNRYSAGKWNKLTTRLLSEDATHVSYEADTPGFSFFAITAEEKGAVPALEGEVTGGAVGEEGEVEGEVEVVAPTEEKAGKAGLVWLLVLLVLVVAVVLYYYYRKKK